MARKVITRSKTNTKKNLIGKALYYLVLLAFWASLFYMLFFSEKMAISAVDISGTENIPKEEVKNILDGDLSGKYMNIVGRNNLLLVRTGKMENDLKERFKKIEMISIKRKFPSTLAVNIKEKKPTLIFSSNGKYLITDEYGEAFEEIGPDSSDFSQTQWPVLIDTSNRPVEEKEMVLTPEIIKFFSQIRSKLEEKLDINLERESETPNRMSGDIRIKTVDGWRIYFNANLDAEKEIEILRMVIQEKISDRNNLEYIDLRSDNKVFYKLKDNVQQEENSGEEQKTTDAQTKVEEKKKKKK